MPQAGLRDPYAKTVDELARCPSHAGSTRPPGSAAPFGLNSLRHAVLAATSIPDAP